MNTLYYGDNLKILRDYIKDESVDLVYLDPPFNSNRNYNVLFKDESGAEADSQITAFEDTWHWNASAEETYHELIMTGDEVARMIESFRGFIGNNQMMAYLVMMAVRLKELHRVLKPSGSLYLHCDPTASHYLKILLDTIFGAGNFRNEIVWKRTGAHGSANRYGDVHDVILFYSKTQSYVWNKLLLKHDANYIKTKYRFEDDRGLYRLVVLTAPGTTAGESGKSWHGYDPTVGGRHWAVPRQALQILATEGHEIPSGLHAQLDFLNEQEFIRFPQKKDGTNGVPEYKYYLTGGAPLQGIFDDIPPINSQAQERLGYPTQKPVALLERIISASSNEDDVVLDPFCGCGTTIAAAQKLNRQWIGIDITHLSIALQKYRLKDAFGLEPVGTRRRNADAPVRNEGRFGPNEPPTVNQAGTLATASPEEPAIADEGVRVPTYRIVGEPEDLDGARQLASEDRYQFQWWALSLIKARPLGAAAGSKEGKKGSDKGIDGTMVFVDDNSNKAKRVIVQVKSGKVKSGDIRDLGHTADRENAAIGVFVTLEKPSRDMTTEAVGKGFYHSEGWNRDYPRLQILTIEELLSGKQVDMPPSSITFKQAERMSKGGKDQRLLEF